MNLKYFWACLPIDAMSHQTYCAIIVLHLQTLVLRVENIYEKKKTFNVYYSAVKIFLSLKISMNMTMNNKEKKFFKISQLKLFWERKTVLVFSLFAIFKKKSFKYSSRWYKGGIVLMSDSPGKAWSMVLPPLPLPFPTKIDILYSNSTSTSDSSKGKKIETEAAKTYRFSLHGAEECHQDIIRIRHMCHDF